ncbi:hypothetical protein [Dasania marina]|uniref:hypothetical protein n=1 Tax=Dasania marina TaxID=471499 RepID=UPI0030D80697|tara:strand:+ start:17825 stop:18781 length:957 start_codon:yes stop_codon:yes gene_type:complete
MFRLIQITQIIFCLVSMILTSLFALSLSGGSIDRISDQEEWGGAVFMAILFVLIGCCIDAGKYLFWSQRQRSHYYGALSLLMMGFSWLASCAFLVSSENSFLAEAQMMSVEYAAVQQQIEAVNQQITYYERLLEKRLNSAYHEQWAEGQSNVDKMSVLNETLLTLTKSLSLAGKDEAWHRVATTQFFTDVSQILGSSVEVVRTAGYGLLSLLLEVSTLGMISLAYAFKVEAGLNHSHAGYPGENSLAADTENGDIEKQQAIARLTADILKGHIAPVLRKIKAADYRLNIDVIRQVLKGLHALGVLEDDKRNSYKLAEL